MKLLLFLPLWSLWFLLSLLLVLLLLLLLLQPLVVLLLLQKQEPVRVPLVFGGRPLGRSCDAAMMWLLFGRCCRSCDAPMMLLLLSLLLLLWLRLLF